MQLPINNRLNYRSLFASAVLFFSISVFAGEQDAIDLVVADSTRPAEHISRDAGRKPAEVLRLAGIKAGGKVADIAAGGGYYTALLSRLVGDSGHVYAVDPKLIFDNFPNAKAGFQKYLAEDPRENVSYSVQRLDKFTVPAQLDSVFMVLYYHDTLWTGEDRAAMNKAFYKALKPGGSYFIVDHNAKAGSGDEPTKTLHRMDQALVAPEVLAAGFEFVEEFNLLRNSSDPLDVSVFDESWRGKTDRFIYLFQKPED